MILDTAYADMIRAGNANRQRHAMQTDIPIVEKDTLIEYIYWTGKKSVALFTVTEDFGKDLYSKVVRIFV